MAKPNFETLGTVELERYIQGLSLQVEDIRALQREAHDWLEVRQQRDRRLELGARPSDFPAPQTLVQVNAQLPQLGSGEERK